MNETSKVEIPDVDLDVKNREHAISVLDDFIPASEYRDGDLLPHNTGLYFQKIPSDVVIGLSAFPYKEAEELGFFKIDIIPNHVYDLIESNEELEQLLEEPIDWNWFLDERFFYEDGRDSSMVLTHLGKHYDLCRKYPPESIEDVAMLIALIRPAKRHLIGKSWDHIKRKIWEKEDGYAFKKSHAIAFAMLVTIHIKLIYRIQKYHSTKYCF